MSTSIGLSIANNNYIRGIVATQANLLLKNEQAASIARQLSEFLSASNPRAPNADRRYITIPNVQILLSKHTDVERQALVARWVADITSKGFTVDRTPTFPFVIANEVGTLTQDPDSAVVFGNLTVFTAGNYPAGMVRRSIVPNDVGAVTAIITERTSNTQVTTDTKQTIAAGTSFYLGNDLIVSF
jgi:hypothetical protein